MNKVKEISKNDLLKVTEHAPDIICRFNNEYKLLYVNPAIEKATGIPQHSFISKTTREIGMPQEHSLLWEKHIKIVFTSGKETTMEFPFMTPKGIRQYQSVLVPEFNDSSKVETVLSISRDITTFKRQVKNKEEAMGYISHELKTPLASLKIFTQLLQKKLIKKGDKKTANQFEKLDTQINKINNIVSDLMDIALLEKGEFISDKEYVDLNKVIKCTVESINGLSKHTIIIKGVANNKVFVDKNRIEQVITNLLTNAIKYSPSHKKIVVTIKNESNKVKTCVIDYGIGIPKDQCKHVFKRFYRISNTNENKFTGLGLGLYICAKIIKEHKGKIWIDDKTKKGTKVCFTLPVTNN